jgi:integrase/recombinase XerD
MSVDESPTVLPPFKAERATEFFEFLKGRIATARKYAHAAADSEHPGGDS